MICYLAMSDYDDGVGGLIFFAVLTPIAGLVMYLNSLCLRPGFDQIHANKNALYKTLLELTISKIDL